MDKQPPSMHAHVNVWLESPESELLFGEGRRQMLAAIDEHGSLTAAAQALKMSYRGLWARLRNSERRLGFKLIESHSGRGPDSGTSLTPEGRALMEQFTQLQTSVCAETDRVFRQIFSGRGTRKRRLPSRTVRKSR